MGRTSCGDIDPGILFYMMRALKMNIYEVDDMLKRRSGFLGLTGYDIGIDRLIEFYGRDRKVDLAFDVYKYQIIKSIGVGLSSLEGLDMIMLSGRYVKALFPFIYVLIKHLFFLGISVKELPFKEKDKIIKISSSSSPVDVRINSLSLPEILFSCIKKTMP
jgi:acetate kinase